MLNIIHTYCILYRHGGIARTEVRVRSTSTSNREWESLTILPWLDQFPVGMNLPPAPAMSKRPDTYSSTRSFTSNLL